MEEERTEGFSTPDSEEELDSDDERELLTSRMMTGKTEAMRKALDTAQGMGCFHQQWMAS